MSEDSASRVEMYKPFFCFSKFLLEPTRELNSFHRNIVHLYSSFEFEIQVVLTFFYIESQARNSLTLCPLPMLLSFRYYQTLASVPIVVSLETLSESPALTPTCRSDSVPSSEQKVRCVLPCYRLFGYVCPRAGLLRMACSYVGIVGVIAVKRTE